MSDNDDIPRSGPAFWPLPKLVFALWVILAGAVILNVLLLAGAARVFGYSGGLPIGIVLLWLFPVTVVGALWLARWVRRLVDEADAGGVKPGQ